MTVYVDDMYLSELGNFGRMKMCHMIADTDEELHAMAKRIGVARKWFQKDRHYDVCMSMRAHAVALGAVQITMRQCAGMCSHRKYLDVLCHPDQALPWLAALRIDKSVN